MDRRETRRPARERGRTPSSFQSEPSAPPHFAAGTNEFSRIEAAVVRHEDLARMVHAFKSPLAAIGLEAELLATRLECSTLGDARRALDRINRNVDFLDRMVMNLLDLCSLDAGQFALRCADTELGALLEHVIERVVPTHERGRVVLDVRTSVTMKVDDLRIERVVANLVHNALRYAPRATRIVVKLDLETTLTRVSVIDEGHGLTQDKIARIFDDYHRTREAGLGLHVSKQIVEAHGGTIGVENIRDEGTRFFFELPIAR